ncbi:MAG: enoyl-CoA hydratase/isomerase family protein [Deltaproteobacteria bacterium]|nr:MAG: enoyl-CoA hydratase/isomerase family protein [Deltaproteobacteria bacterium]
MTTRLVETEKDGPVAVITLCNPPANTYSYEMMRQLDEAILAARFDPEVHALVVTGLGEKFFCAGADIGMLQSSDPTYKYYFCLHANETMLRLEQTPKIVIAAINGHCVGGGLEIALACDLRIVRAGGGKLGLPEVKLGVLPGTGGTQRLARVVGKAKAIELMAEGENFDQETALALGLVNKRFEAASADDFLGQVVDYAKSLCPPSHAAKAVGHIKRAVQTGAEVGLEQGLALERELQQRLFESEDAREGLAAFAEKRAPRFTGR